MKERIADRPVITETDTATTTRLNAHAAFIVQRVDNFGVVEATFAYTRHTRVKCIIYIVSCLLPITKNV